MIGRAFALVIGAAGVATCLAAAVLHYVGRDSPLPGLLVTSGYVFDVVFALLFTAWPVMGTVLAVRVPRNAVGPVLLAMGLAGSGVQLTEAYASAASISGPVSPEVTFVVWLGLWVWIPPTILLGALIAIVPHGALPSPRWRPWFLVTAGAGLLQSSYAFFPASMPPLGIVNPFGIDSPIVVAAAAIGTGAVAAFMLLSAASLLVRFRRSRGVERQQLKWIAFAGIFVAVLTPLASLLYGGDPLVAQLASMAAALTVATFPVVIGLAVLRYRLYDIDLVIRRTVVYGTLSAAIAATYIGLVVLFQAALRPFTGGSEIAVAGSTLATLALVQPLLRRIQDGVDRRFYRSRYDAVRTLDAFAARLRDEVDLDALRHDVLGVIGDTVRPAHASVWLRGVR